MQRIKHKTISITSKILGFLGIAAFLTVYFFAYTAPGISWILNSSLSDPHASISISSVSGSFKGVTTIEKFSYQSDAADISFDKFTLLWNPLSIFSDQIQIRELEGSNLRVNLKTYGNPDTPDKNTYSIESPIETNIVKASIKNILVNAAGKSVYTFKHTDIDNIYLADNFFAEKIIFNTGENQQVALSGHFGFSGSSVINLTTESTIALPGKNNSIRAKGTLVGNIAQLRFLQRIDLPFEAEIRGRITNVLKAPAWNVDASLHRADMPVLSGKHFLNYASGDISFRGDARHFELTSDLSIVDSDKNRWSANLTAVSQDSLMDFALAMHNLNPDSNADASFKGSYNFSLAAELTDVVRGLKVEGRWNNIKLTLNNDNTIASRSGNIRFDGEKYISQLSANDIKLQKLGPTITRLSMNTSNEADGRIVFTGKASTTKGGLNLSGKVVKKYDNYKIDRLLLSGNNFPLMRNPQAHIVISPDISFIRKDNVLTSTGTVKVPMANIQLQEFQKTIHLIASFIGSEKVPAKSSGQVDVEFGQSVWMHGYGLNAHVTGDLSLRDLSSKNIVASGELRVLRGNYRNLTEKHKLNGGRLKFDNHHFDDPELELNIARHRSASDARGKITGRLQKLYIESNQRSSVKIPGNNFRLPGDQVALKSLL